MHINENLLPVFKNVAIVVTMHHAASYVTRPWVGHEAAKEELTKLINAELCGETTVVLTLDLMASNSVSPLYHAFGSEWTTPRAKALVTNLLREVPVLQSVKFDIQMRTR